MNIKKIVVILIALLTVNMAGAQDAGRPRTPAIPAAAGPAERAMLVYSARMISKGQFDVAQQRLKSMFLPVNAPVYVDWESLPEALRAQYRTAVKHALLAWNEAPNRPVTFNLVSTEGWADIVIRFEETISINVRGEDRLLCIDAQPEWTTPDGSAFLTRRKERVRICWNTNVPGAGQKHSAASITHLVGQALGAYLGLDQTENPADIMGPDTHGASVAVKPSDRDLRSAREIQLVRTQLVHLAEKQIAAYMPRPVLALDKLSADAGDVWRGDTAHFVFKIKNTGDVPLLIDAKPGCGCTVASFDKQIAPGAEGKVEADMRTTSFHGKTTKTVTISTNDPDHLQAVVHISTNVRPLTKVEPADFSPLALKDEGPTLKEYRLEAAGPVPIHITRATCSAKYADVRVEPATPGSAQPYKLTLTVGPEAPVGRSVIRLTAFTDSTREPTVTFSAICDKGILATPVGIYLGSLSAKTVMPISRTVTLLKHEGAFHIKKIVCDDPALDVRQETVHEGSEYRVNLSYKGGWPQGFIQRKIAIETDDARQPRIEVSMIATIAGEAAPNKP